MALDADTRDQLVETVRRFVTERLRPLEAQVSENDAIPDDVIDEMKALGLFGLSIPAEYGGLDLGMEEEVLVALELGRTSPAFRSAFGTNVGIGDRRFREVVLHKRVDQDLLTGIVELKLHVIFCG